MENQITIKTLVDEDIVNYKKMSMFIGFPSCNWKCEKECKQKVCQNSELAKTPNITVNIDKLIDRYLQNPITQAVVCGGLEPMDSWEDLREFIIKFREKSNDDIVIYTGYYKNEIKEQLEELKMIKGGHLIVKFGRFKPNGTNYFNESLGVTLASDNQYVRIYGG